MRELFPRLVIAVSVLWFAAAADGGESFRVGAIVVDRPWARASIGTSRPTAAYMTIRNTDDYPDRLMAISSPAAESAAVHRMTMANGVMAMRALDALEIPAGETIVLKPGGLHIMLAGLRAPLKKGGTVRLHLTFERAGDLEMPVPVAGPGASAYPRDGED